MKGRRLALVSTVSLSLVLLSTGPAGGLPGKSKQAPGPIRALAMDGARVAYDVANPRGSGSGNKVLVWNLLTGKVVKVSGRRTDQADTTSTGYGVRELAISEKRVSWIINQGGNTESSDYLCASSVANPKEHTLAEATRSGPYQSSPGSWISGLVGSDGVLAVNRWTVDEQGGVTEARLVLIGTWGLRRIAVGEQTLLAQSADAGRIAVLRSDGSIGVYATSGRLLLQILSASPRDLALHGKYLVVLTKARKLAVYDSHTGALLRTLAVRGPTRAALQNLDVESNLAVYTVWPEVRVVNLTTGKDRAIGNLRAFPLFDRVFAQIEPVGVVYAGNVRNRPVRFSTTGTLVFVPMATVAAAVR